VAQTIGVGNDHVVVLGANGVPYGAGSNQQGQITGAAASEPTLTPMSGLPRGVHGVSVSAGPETSLVVGSNGVVYGTGSSDYSDLTVSAGNVLTTLTPLKGLPHGVRATAVSGGGEDTLVLGSNGIAYGAGLNGSGELTTGGTVGVLAPLVGLPSGVRATAIAMGGQHSLVLGSDGVAYGTGDNSYGQLTGTLAYRTTLTPLAGLPTGVKVISISAGIRTSFVTASDGRVYGAGFNGDDELTSNAPSQATQLTALAGLPAGVRATRVSGGFTATVVLGSDGLLYGTGVDTFNDLVLGRSLSTLTCLTHGIPDDMTEVVMGRYDVVVRDAEGVVYGNGDNATLQLTSNSPVTQSGAFALLAGERLTSRGGAGLTGAPQIGGTLTAQPGAWSVPPTGYSYQWRAAGVAIPGAHSRTYHPTLVTRGLRVSVTVTAHRGGFTSGATTSPGTAAVTTGAPLAYVIRPKPAITGTHRSGHVLQVAHLRKSGFTPAATGLSYQWLRNGTPIAHATASSYRLTAADRGQRVSVRVTASRVGYHAGHVTTHAVSVTG
jgi:alpha-tubulin suppressor-like RCC1 family protein